MYKIRTLNNLWKSLHLSVKIFLIIASLVLPVYCASTQEAEEGLQGWGQLGYTTQQDLLKLIPTNSWRDEQVIKCLPHTQGPGPQNAQEKVGVIIWTCNPNTGDAEMGILGGLLKPGKSG